MKRMEIICNKSIEEDLFDAFEKNKLDIHYTKIPGVHGKGTSDPKFGDSVWPEENFILIIYCDEEQAGKILSVITDLKKYFPEEGIKVFEICVECSI